jgi:hypothetical protein
MPKFIVRAEPGPISRDAADFAIVFFMCCLYAFYYQALGRVSAARQSSYFHAPDVFVRALPLMGIVLITMSAGFHAAIMIHEAFTNQINSVMCVAVIAPYLVFFIYAISLSTLVALDRSRTILLGKKFTREQAIKIVLAAFLFSMCLVGGSSALPAAKFSKESRLCYIDWKRSDALFMGMIFFTCLGLVTVSVCYGLVYRKVAVMNKTNIREHKLRLAHFKKASIRHQSIVDVRSKSKPTSPGVSPRGGSSTSARFDFTAKGRAALPRIDSTVKAQHPPHGKRGHGSISVTRAEALSGHPQSPLLDVPEEEGSTRRTPVSAVHVLSQSGIMQASLQSKRVSLRLVGIQSPDPTSSMLGEKDALSGSPDIVNIMNFAIDGVPHTPRQNLMMGAHAPLEIKKNGKPPVRSIGWKLALNVLSYAFAFCMPLMSMFIARYDVISNNNAVRAALAFTTFLYLPTMFVWYNDTYANAIKAHGKYVWTRFKHLLRAVFCCCLAGKQKMVVRLRLVKRLPTTEDVPLTNTQTASSVATSQLKDLQPKRGSDNDGLDRNSTEPLSS